MRFVILMLTTVMLANCTWVEPSEQGKSVRVAYGKNLGACTAKGTITVSVKDRVAFVKRKDLKVRDELESLARNEAAELGADTVQAINEPNAGEQKFGAYQCH